MLRRHLSEFSNVLIGMEVELEFHPGYAEPVNMQVPQIFSNYWDIIGDSSLRNGAECIFSHPLTAKCSDTALKVLDKTISCLNTNISNMFLGEGVRLTDRTSVHVHIDFRDYNISEVISFVTKYIALEELLFLLVDPARSKNNFCKKLNDSTLLSECTGSIISTNNIEKYSALNTRTLQSIGSIEFRHHHGAYTYEELSKWLVTVLTFREYLLSVNYEQLIRDIRENPEDLVSSLLGNDYPELSLEECKVALNRGITSLVRLLEKERLFKFKVPKGTLVDFYSNFKR